METCLAFVLNAVRRSQQLGMAAPLSDRIDMHRRGLETCNYKVANKYDVLGRRFERTVSDDNYMTDAWDLVHERRRFVWSSAPAGNGWLMLREIIDTDTSSPPDGSFDTPSRIRTYTWGRDLAGHGGGSSGDPSCGRGLGPVGCLTGAGGIGGLLSTLDTQGTNDSKRQRDPASEVPKYEE